MNKRGILIAIILAGVIFLSMNVSALSVLDTPTTRAACALRLGAGDWDSLTPEQQKSCIEGSQTLIVSEEKTETVSYDFIIVKNEDYFKQILEASSSLVGEVPKGQNINSIIKSKATDAAKKSIGSKVPVTCTYKSSDKTLVACDQGIAFDIASPLCTYKLTFDLSIPYKKPETAVITKCQEPAGSTDSKGCGFKFNLCDAVSEGKTLIQEVASAPISFEEALIAKINAFPDEGKEKAVVGEADLILLRASDITKNPKIQINSRDKTEIDELFTQLNSRSNTIDTKAMIDEIIAMNTLLVKYESPPQAGSTQLAGSVISDESDQSSPLDWAKLFSFALLAGIMAAILVVNKRNKINNTSSRYPSSYPLHHFLNSNKYAKSFGKRN